jgi:hypothetical protein
MRQNVLYVFRTKMFFIGIFSNPNSCAIKSVHLSWSPFNCTHKPFRFILFSFKVFTFWHYIIDICLVSLLKLIIAFAFSCVKLYEHFLIFWYLIYFFWVYFGTDNILYKVFSHIVRDMFRNKLQKSLTEYRNFACLSVLLIF